MTLNKKNVLQSTGEPGDLKCTYGQSDPYSATWVGFTQKIRDNITVFCLLFWNRGKKLEMSRLERLEEGSEERQETKGQFP